MTERQPNGGRRVVKAFWLGGLASGTGYDCMVPKQKQQVLQGCCSCTIGLKVGCPGGNVV